VAPAGDTARISAAQLHAGRTGGQIVVHTDDLAVSVATPTPPFPDEVFTPVQDLLVRLAVRRHGQSAVIGALTRRERSRPISAF
jgi:hypothetical protein